METSTFGTEEENQLVVIGFFSIQFVCGLLVAVVELLASITHHTTLLRLANKHLVFSQCLGSGVTWSTERFGVCQHYKREQRNLQILKGLRKFRIFHCFVNINDNQVPTKRYLVKKFRHLTRNWQFDVHFECHKLLFKWQLFFTFTFTMTTLAKPHIIITS